MNLDVKLSPGVDNSYQGATSRLFVTADAEQIK